MSWLDSVCQQPTFLQPSEGAARHCGQLSGVIGAIILSIITVIISLVVFFNSRQITTSLDGTVIIKRNYWPLIIGLIVIALFWLIIPLSSGWFAAMRWRGYQAERDAYVRAGLSPQDALKQQQKLYETQVKADATMAAGSEIADAIDGANNPYRENGYYEPRGYWRDNRGLDY